MAEISLSAQLVKILDDYDKEVHEVAEKEIQSTARAAAKKLRNESPKGSPRRRHYAEGWATKKVDGGIIVYNRTNPQLTHLLENGHIVRNKKGTYGRAPAIKHIKPVEEWANNEVVERIEAKL